MDLSIKSHLLQKNSLFNSFKFYKFHAAGNDFILIDDRDHSFDLFNPSDISLLCHRSFGIGADGLILLKTSKIADFRMCFFNSDGKEANMCGNGLRCLIAFVKFLGVKKEELTIETKSSVHKCSHKKGLIKTSFGSPKKIELNRKLKICNQERVFHLIDTGVYHAIHFTKNLDDHEFLQIAKAVRFHKDFKDEGVNVSFVKIDGNSLSMRTYEKGVEAETLACGTAAAASGTLAYLIFGLESPLGISFSSLDRVVYACEIEGSKIKDMSLEGEAKYVFSGDFLKS